MFENVAKGFFSKGIHWVCYSSVYCRVPSNNINAMSTLQEVNTCILEPHPRSFSRLQIFVKAFPRGANGRIGLLESTGLVEIGDCLTAINGVPLDKATTLQEVMGNIRSAKSPLSLRFARYPPPPPPLLSMPSSPASTIGGSAKSMTVGFDSCSPNGARNVDATAAAGAFEPERREDPELDDVLNSALMVGLGERVADIQKRNAKLLQAVGRVGHAAAVKRDGVERVASAAAALATEAATFPRTLEILAAARQDASAVCEAMARLNELLAARERAQAARRRTNEEGALAVGGVGGERSGSKTRKAPVR